MSHDKSRWGHDPIPHAHWTVCTPDGAAVNHLKCSHCGFVLKTGILEHSCPSCNSVMRRPDDRLTGDRDNERG